MGDNVVTFPAPDGVPAAVVNAIDGEWLVATLSWPPLRKHLEHHDDFARAVTAAMRLALQHNLALFVAPGAVGMEIERIAGQRPSAPRRS